MIGGDKAEPLPIVSAMRGKTPPHPHHRLFTSVLIANIMPTSLEAVGAASACLQVIASAADLIRAYKKVYDGRSTRHDHFEEQAQQMCEAVNLIQGRCQTMAKMQTCETNKKLADVAEACSAAAEKLEEEVRYVTSLHEKGNILKAINATLRASSHRQKIAGLELFFSMYGRVVETELLSHIW